MKIALVALVIATSATGAGAQGNTFVRGIGALDCKVYIAKVSESLETALAYANYLDGFVTGHAWAKRSLGAPRMSEGQLQQSVFRFCKEHPQEAVATALGVLMLTIEKTEGVK